MQSRAAWEVLGCVLGTLNQSVTDCNVRVGSRERLIAERCKETDGLCPTPPTGNPEFLEGFQQTVFKCKVRDGGCYKLLGAGILCSCPCPQKSGQDIPVNLQQDRCCSLVCNLLSLYKWKSVLSPLKFRALRTGSPVYFRQHS